MFKAFKNTLIYYSLRPLIALLSVIPLAWIPRVGRCLGKIAGVFACSLRRRAENNLLKSNLNFSAFKRKRTIDLYFQSLGISVIEALSAERLLKNKTSFILDDYDPAIASALKDGAIFITGHLGNFELLAAYLAQHFGGLTTLAKQSYDSRLSRLLESRRKANDVNTLWVDDASHSVKALRALRAKTNLGVLIDYRDKRSSAKPISFLGQRAKVSDFAIRLAVKDNKPLIFASIHREKKEDRSPFSYRIRLHLIKSRALNAMEVDLWEYFESLIIERPEDWMWTLTLWGHVDEENI